MPKDYAQKKSATPSQRQHRRGSIRALIVIALLLATGWFYSQKDPDSSAKTELASQGIGLNFPSARQAAEDASPPVNSEVTSTPNVQPSNTAGSNSTTTETRAFEPLPSTRLNTSESVPSSDKATERAADDPAIEEELYLTAAEALAAFQFYQLTQQTPEVVDVRPPSARNQPLIPEQRQQEFVVQAASFRNRQDADNLRAQLILAGIEEARVDRIDGSNGIWYRVVMGPMDSRSRANAIARQLRNRNMSPLVRAIDL